MRSLVVFVFTLAAAILIGPSSVLAGGGPDSFGYVWLDGGGWDWIDTASATPLNMGDDEARLLPLGFSFNFYGVSYENAWIVSNGYISFAGDATTFLSVCPLPDPTALHGALYLYWADLAPPSGGSVSVQAAGEAPYRHFILTYDRVRLFGVDDAITMQAILTEGVNWTQVLYDDSGPDGAGAVIGTERADGLAGLTILCDESDLADGARIYIGPPVVENFCGEPAGSALRLMWDDPSGAERFTVEGRDTGAGLPRDFLAVGETTETTLIDPAALECSIREYLVTAYAGELGQAGPAGPLTVVYAPKKPTNPFAVNVGGTQIHLAWVDNSNCEDGYVVERRTGGALFAPVALLPADAQDWPDEPPPTGDPVYRIKAKKGLISGEYSDETPVGAVLQSPFDLSAEGYSDAKISLRWSDAARNEDGWAIERKAASDPPDAFAPAGWVGPDATEFLDFNLAPDTDYDYRVRAFVRSIFGPYSNIAQGRTLAEGEPPAADDDTSDDDSSSTTSPLPIATDDDMSANSCSVCGL